MMKPAMAMLAGALVLAAPASRADNQFKLLVVALPDKWHYEYIPIAREGFDKLARLHSFDLAYSNRPEALEGDLRQYAAVVFLNTVADGLNAAQRARFEDYMRAGGNAVVVHSAAVIPPNSSWPWYEKLVGRSFKIHPMLQTGVATVVDKGFPATYGIPERWIWSDEWYELTNPYKVPIHPVLNVDESSYDPTKIWPGQVSTGMGKDHPVAWYHQVDKGRVFVTTLGHNGEMYRDPTYLSHLLGGIYWAATGRGQKQ